MDGKGGIWKKGSCLAYLIIFISGVRVDQSPWPKSGLLKMRTKSGLWSILEAERVNIEQPQRKDN